MLRNTLRCGLAMMVLGILLTGCSNTQMTGVWQEPSFKGQILESVMVIGLAENPNIKRRFEDSFVAQFQSKGVRSASGYALIPAETQMTKENVSDHQEIIKKAAVDNQMKAVLATHLVSVENVDEYIPPTYTTQPSHYYGQFGGFYSSTWKSVYSQDSYLTRRYVRLETNIYDTATERMIWSASSQIVDPNSIDKLVDDLIKTVIQRLTKDGLLPTK